MIKWRYVLYPILEIFVISLGFFLFPEKAAPVPTVKVVLRVLSIQGSNVAVQPFIAPVLDLRGTPKHLPTKGDVLNCKEEEKSTQYREHNDKIVTLDCDKAGKFVLQGVAFVN